MMNLPIQFIDKGTKSDETSDKFIFHEIVPSLLCFILVIVVTVLICPMFFPENGLAHSDLDPEIAEVSLELLEEPNNVGHLLRRGQLYRFNGKFQDSLQDLEQAKKLDPSNRKVALEHCRTLLALGHDAEAESALNHYLHGESGISRVMAVVERAHLYERTGRPKLAIADFSEALHYYPTVELYLARGRLQEGLGQLEAAATGYQEGLGRMQQASILRQQLIRLKVIQGKLPDALALMDEEPPSNSVKTEWYMRRAKILAAMGKTKAMEAARTQALAEANRALAKRPTALHRVARAKVYQALGNLEAAKQDLQMAVKAAPRFAEARDLLKKLEVQ